MVAYPGGLDVEADPHILAADLRQAAALDRRSHLGPTTLASDEVAAL